MELNINPISRKNELVVQQTKSEILIYDLKINKIYCLNKTSAMVWNLCDGQKSVAMISQSMTKQLRQSVTEDFVRLALDQLKEENLLESYCPPLKGLSRREAIRRTVLASVVALPLITFLVAPRAADAQSIASACPTSGPGSVGDTCDCAPGTANGVTCGIGGDFGGGACQAKCTCTAGTVIRAGTNTVIGLCS